MGKLGIAGVVALVLALPAAAQPPGPAAAKEHQWLHQLVGQWEADVEVWSEPGKPPMKLQSTETTRRIGEFWIQSVGEIVAPARPFARSLTLGFDLQQKKYVGTWVDSNSTHLGTYEGTMDAAGKVLTLEGDTPSPFDPSSFLRVREVIEIQNPNQKVVTTYLQAGESWIKLVSVSARKKK